MTSIITEQARARCTAEAARLAHLDALRAIELARATKRINDHYDALKLGTEPQQLGRRIFDRRASDTSDRLARYGITV